MKLSEAKQSILTKVSMAGGLKAPSDEELSLFCKEALVFVASRCAPVVLLREARCDLSEEILRYIDNEMLILMPDTPDFTDSKAHLQIDEELNYAVINKTCSLMSRSVEFSRRFSDECEEIIRLYKANATKGANRR